tara:strand:- start:493 stop:1101 length:609 start_codon:yes stop_codon:yes gene_type:complete
MFHLLFSNKISFNYGIIGEMKNNSDTLVNLKDQTEIVNGDKIRINLGIINNTNIYILYKDTENVYSLLYEKTKAINSESLLDTAYVTGLSWNTFGGLPGKETFYLINSYTELVDLKKLLNRYGSAPKKAKVKMAKKIESLLNSIDPNAVEDLSSLTNRLDKPIVGGVAFRGDDDDALKPQSLIYECNGANGIAFKKIILNHK